MFYSKQLCGNAYVMLGIGPSIPGRKILIPRYRNAYPQTMRLLEALAGTFFRTFGITEPTERTRRRAAWFIFVMFTVLAVGFFSLGAILFHML